MFIEDMERITLSFDTQIGNSHYERRVGGKVIPAMPTLWTVERVPPKGAPQPMRRPPAVPTRATAKASAFQFVVAE